ncbi:MAG: stage II sporulation protein M [Planctomycetota bacterium]
MNVAELLESRRANWRELEQLCLKLKGFSRRRIPPPIVSRFSALYRAACADLALADSYQLPPDTVLYLHRLVGHAHNLLYRSRTFNWRMMLRELLVAIPQRLFTDNCLRLAFVVFWGVFLLTGLMSYHSPDFAHQVLGNEQIDAMEDMYASAPAGRPIEFDAAMAGFYFFHNPRIGLQCFAFGLLLGVGGLYITLYNAAVLGAVFGYMAQARQPMGGNFFNFVTAHGPMELTAVVLCAGAGMRLGFALIDTRAVDAAPGDDKVDLGEARQLAPGAAPQNYLAPRQYARVASLRRAARTAFPAVGAAMLMFFVAAFIEGFISPSSLPYVLKAAVSVFTAGLLMFYFVFLGLPRESLGTEEWLKP